MQIVPLDHVSASDADAAALHEVARAAAVADRPQDPAPRRPDFVARLRSARETRRRLHLVAWDGDTVLGYAELWLSLIDNLHMGLIGITVHPDHRRRGAGTALLDGTLALLEAEGRRLALAETVAGTAGDDFAARLGVSLAQVDRRSLLRRADPDPADVAALSAAPHPGYRIVQWRGHAPDELLAGFARAKTAMNDAPFDDAELEDFTYTPETVREDERIFAGLGDYRVVAAVHEASGTVAGFTELLVHPERARAEQEDTGVVPAHRGHGLGLWVKARMLTGLADCPWVTEILTTNAASNKHMLAVNDRLGFRPWTDVHGWQSDVATLRGRLGRG